MQPIAVTDKAYLTIVSHLTKYPHAVSGLLLGPLNPPTVTNAFPLAHSALTLYTAPLSETALNLASLKASSDNIRILGVYFGNDNASDNSISTVPTRLAEAVRRYYYDAFLLMIDAPSLAPQARLTQHCFRLCVRKDATTWARGTRSKEELVVSDNALKLADMLMTGRLDVHVVADFEDHCLDPSHDWFNEGVEERWFDMSTSS